MSTKYKKTEFNSSISWGYPVDEFEDSLRRAFVDGKADYIELDGNSGRFLHNCVGYGQEQGWLGPIKEDCIPGDQWTVWQVRLTDYGKKYFGVAK
jgi:hypothetical protein